ncbi:MAG: AlwI family type II restriction endonuclease [Bacteroidales bacterium]|nr:AlwI family type II restriction endonuclease [Bacteroidales bacterium]
MAKVDSRVLFLTTSPRTPEKMIPEIELLIRRFDGLPWNANTQQEFMKELRQEQFFHGRGENDPALSARDRINRAPKSLGFVTLSPCISLTPAGQALLTSDRKDEVFLRQMLKFQVPSPYHKPSAKAAAFRVKPYLEMLRLVRFMGTLQFDELQIFGMQLIDWRDFDRIVKKIEAFRMAKAQNQGSYRRFKTEHLREELTQIFNDRIQSGEIKTRESQEVSLSKFLRTQSCNMRDYADACFRYLRATGLVNVSHVGKSLSIVPERIDDVDYILKNVDREPCFVDDEDGYLAYLGKADVPVLLTDDSQKLLARLRADFPEAKVRQDADVALLKKTLSELIEKRKQESIRRQVREIKDFKLYDEIQNTYRQILNNELFDAPLMFEWNTWRAMTMLDGGEVKANFSFDDFGKPLSTAQGNVSDIVCDYGDFLLSVEVTLACGQRQYEMEGEPVSRHLGKMKMAFGKPCYCLFVAPTINEASIAHFYALHKTNISYYGGKSVIVPVPLNLFQKMLEDSYKATFVPDPLRVLDFFKFSESLAREAEDENVWYERVKEKASNWLA